MKASLLVIQNQSAIFCGPKDGGKYDFTEACPVCGTGARRIDPITLPTGRLQDRISNTLKFEVVIPGRLVPAIKSVAPQCLREIRDEKTGAVSPFFQLVPEMSLPRWSKSTVGYCLSKMLPQCPTCKRDGYFNVSKEPLLLSYNEAVPSFSVAETFEHFGKSRLQADFKKSLIASSFLVVSEAIEKVLAGEPGVEFVSVTFEH